jgi:uncharacterized protein involved in exopolysaccharide biosynthesis
MSLPSTHPPALAPLSLQRVLRAVRRRRAVAALLFVGSLTVVWAGAAFAPRAYRSQTKLFIRLGRENSTLDPTATLGDSPVVSVPPSRENEINSVIEILKSQPLLEQVVDRVGPAVILGRAPLGAAPAAPPPPPAPRTRTVDDRYRAAALLVKGVQVDAIRKSNIIQITFDGPSPEVSQAVLSGLIDCYLVEHARVNRTPGAHEFLIEQTGKQRADLARAEDALRAAKEETGLVAPDAQRQALVERIGRVESDLAGVVVSLDAADAELAALRSRSDCTAAPVVAGTTRGLPNQGQDAMRAQVFALQVKELELRSKYPPNHPEVALARQEVTAAEALFAKERADREQVSTAPNPVHQDAELSLARQEAARAALKARHSALEAQLARERERLKTFGRNQTRIAQLQREADLHEGRYRRLVDNLTRSQIDRALEAEKISNVSVIQPATFDPLPVRPSVPLILALGAALAAVGAVGGAVLLDAARPLPLTPPPPPLDGSLTPAPEGRYPNQDGVLGLTG